MSDPLLLRTREAHERPNAVRSRNHSKLRGCDLVKIKFGTLVTGTVIRTRAMFIQQKIDRPVHFEITADVRANLLAWLERRGGTVEDYAFPVGSTIPTIQARVSLLD